jgi:transketolase
MLLYSLLHLSGYKDMTLEQLKNFRQWGSKTAGHPEYGEAGGIETTTGPLGQGISTAVGMALAERLLAARFNRRGQTLVDHHTYVIAGDGDLMEGVTAEAVSLAGHLQLDKLIVLYDDNQITIDGGTDLSFTEDVSARFAAYGWHTQKIDGHDRDAVHTAIRAAQSSNRPSLIQCRTHIGHGAPNKQDSSSAHGAPLGTDEVRATKEGMGWPQEPTFFIPPEVPAYFEQKANAGRSAYTEWMQTRSTTDSELVQRFDAQMSDDFGAEVWAALPQFEIGASIATRKASGAVLNAVCDLLPQMIGGSADLAGSNGTTLKDYGHVQAGEYGSDRRNIHYGVREHAMGAIMNGLALHKGIRPYGGTFLIFSDYMRPAIRLAALMKQPVTYVFTHDSVFLGEDGPTHQPIEQAMSLRMIPNSWVVRPGDATETAAAWRIAMERKSGPTSLLLTRQGVPVLENSSIHGALKGAYVVRKERGNAPKVVLLATGSELHLALDAADLLGPDTRVVSMPCWELFEQQSAAYRESVIPANSPNRFAIEAGRSFGWERYVGDHGATWGIDRFGASAPAKRIAAEFGFNAESFAAFVRKQLD